MAHIIAVVYGSYGKWARMALLTYMALMAHMARVVHILNGSCDSWFITGSRGLIEKINSVFFSFS